VELDLRLDLAEPLYKELIDAANECKLTAHTFAAQAVEACLAGRRLESHVTAAPHGPRIRTHDVEDL
jgi:hypothetical protein